MVHHAVYCLMAAFASERMLVIDKADEIFGLEKGPFIYYVIVFICWGQGGEKGRIKAILHKDSITLLSISDFFKKLFFHG